MKFKTKRRIVFVALLVLALWPAAHPVMCRLLDFSPWKAFGWAMYCVPPKGVMLTITELPQGEPVPMPEFEEMPGAIYREYLLFFGMRKALHRRATPEALAREILRENGSFDGLEIIVRQFGVDRATARMTMGYRDRYTYRREELIPAPQTADRG